MYITCIFNYTCIVKRKWRRRSKILEEEAEVGTVWFSLSEVAEKKGYLIKN